MLYLLSYESRILNIITIWSVRDLVFLSHCVLFHLWLWCGRLRICTLHSTCTWTQVKCRSGKCRWEYNYMDSPSQIVLWKGDVLVHCQIYSFHDMWPNNTHPNIISPKRKNKNLGDVCVRKIIKHWWQVKIEKSQTPSGKISIVLWLGVPRQRTIEILPLGVCDFSILTCHRC